MAPSTTLTSKLKVHLKMAIQRLRMVQQKDEAIAKQQRRAMAQLLEQSKVESARIRVENIIRSDLTTELHEILELYCELLLARIGLIDNPPPSSSITSTSSSPSDDRSTPNSTTSTSTYPTPTPIDPGLTEAILTLIHASPRTTIKELQTIRALLIEKYGREFGQKCTEDRELKVPERVRRKLSVEPPGRELVESYLRAIAGAYDVEYGGDGDGDDVEGDGSGLYGRNDADEDDDDNDTPSDGAKVLAQENSSATATPPTEPPLTTNPTTSKNNPANTRRRSSQTQTQSPPPPSPPHRNPSTDPRISIAPPSPSTDSPNPTVKLPGAPDGRVGARPKGAGGNSSAKINGGMDSGGGGGSKGKAGGTAAARGGGGKAEEVPGKVPDVDDLEKRFAMLKR